MISGRLRACAAFALIAFAAGCDSTDPVVPTAIVFSQGSATLDAIGADVTLTATVNDQNGNAMTEADVTWTVNGTSVAIAAVANPASPGVAAQTTAVTGSTVVVTAVANGNSVITATVEGITKTVQVLVAQTASSAQKFSGDAVSGAAGAALPQPVQVRVQDRLGAPVAGHPVAFSVTAGGGSVSPASIVTDANGVASATWTLGTSGGEANTLNASASGSAPLTFVATAVAGPPAALIVSGGDNQSTPAGTAVSVAPSVRVTDAFGNPVPSIAVTFAVASGGGSLTGGAVVTNTNGIATVGSWTLGTTAGPNSLTATVSGVQTVTIVATGITGPPALMSIVAGNNQTGAPGAVLSVRPSVRVTDAFNNPIANLSVTFAVTAGGGSVSGAATTTDATGVATVGGWTLGPVPGSNTLSATVNDAAFAGNPAVFTATTSAPASYNITLRFLSAMTPSQTAAFTQAAARWSSLIATDPADLSVALGAGSCGANATAINEVIDDVLIFATVNAIDGPGGILGSAGPCFIRNGGFFTIIGQMRFDIADVAALEASGSFTNVVLHEMGHVLGIGTLWPDAGLVSNTTPNGGPPRDTFFGGANGIAGFNAIGGNTYTGGVKVPVENTGGPGTINAHWRESVLQNELMTGFLNAGVNPLSQLTVRSLQDLGYTVNTGAADVFSLALSLRSTMESVVLDLGDDVAKGPIYSIDKAGNVRRVR